MSGKRRRPRKLFRRILVVVLLGLLLFGAWLFQGVATQSKSARLLIRFDSPVSLDSALATLKKRGLIRDPAAYAVLARLTGHPREIQSGTYRVELKRGPIALLTSLEDPVVKRVRLPETNWARRNANLLQKAEICRADEYMALVKKPQEFQALVDFTLPSDSLEGYLYPDTYDFPPLLGARGVILRQLLAFSKKVWEPLQHPKNLHRLLTIASLVELETKFASERPIVAGVIENRLKKGMRLQIDASINYGLQKWRPLARSEYRTVDSPYNLYRNDGLPPTPICSPTIATIRDTLNPRSHSYLYYVALPTGESLFSESFDEHRQNIKRRKAAVKSLVIASDSAPNRSVASGEPQ